MPSNYPFIVHPSILSHKTLIRLHSLSAHCLLVVVQPRRKSTQTRAPNTHIHRLCPVNICSRVLSRSPTSGLTILVQRHIEVKTERRERQRYADK